MLVRLWAGPSCIARAISRRRSSWAPRSRRETARGGPLASDRPGCCRRGASQPILAPRPARHPAIAQPPRSPRVRRGSGRGHVRLPSRTSTCDSIRAARLVNRTSWSGAGPETVRGRRADAGGPSRPAGRALVLVTIFSAAVARLDSWRGGLGLAPVATGKSTSAISVSSWREVGCQLPTEVGEAGHGGGAVSVMGRRRRLRLRRTWRLISPPASGSSPGASRTRRPGSGR